MTNRCRIGFLLFCLTCLACTGCGSAEKPLEVHVAAAANLRGVLEDIARTFLSRTGIHIVPTIGATAQLSQQIENGAPVDLFLSAVDTTSNEMRVVVEEACERTSSFEDQIVAGLEALLDFVAEHPAASRMCMVEAISATPSSARLYDAGMRDFVQTRRTSGS